MRETLVLSVVVTAERASDTLARTMAALAGSDLDRRLWELVIVDVSRDGSVKRATAPFADRIVRLNTRYGAGYARNRGFEASSAANVVFIEPNAAVRPDALRQIVNILAVGQAADAVFGCFEAGDVPHSLASRYGMLLHEYRHRYCDTAGDAPIAPCRAFRRDAFATAGMYDEWRSGTRRVPDGELRNRLGALGYRVMVSGGVVVQPLDRWTVREVLTADLYDARLPWDAVARNAEPLHTDRRRRARERSATLLMWGAIAALLLSTAAGSVALGSALAALALFLGATMPVHAFMARQGGWFFAAVAATLHAGHHLVHGARLGLALLRYHLVGEPRPDPAADAFAEVGMPVWPPAPRQRRPLSLATDGVPVDR